jgi:lipase chaperone LimK
MYGWQWAFANVQIIAPLLINLRRQQHVWQDHVQDNAHVKKMLKLRTCLSAHNDRLQHHCAQVHSG